MRHRELLDRSLELYYKKVDAECAAFMAQREYQEAKQAYNAAVAEDERRKAELIEIMEDGVETPEERIMFILDNKEELLELFFSERERLDYESRELDRRIAKDNEEVEEND